MGTPVEERPWKTRAEAAEKKVAELETQLRNLSEGFENLRSQPRRLYENDLLWKVLVERMAPRHLYVIARDVVEAAEETRRYAEDCHGVEKAAEVGYISKIELISDYGACQKLVIPK